MTEKMIENNKVSVIGEIVSDFTFSHEVFGEGFYMVELSVNRLSEQADIIPLMVWPGVLSSWSLWLPVAVFRTGRHTAGKFLNSATF